ncbi:2-dehydropantoate 2-reductase [bacterium]|nr:2-dehydropantoate 2-reductase [bacterium]
MSTTSSGKFRGRIGVIGAGALGALYGVRMARAGSNVHLLARSDYDAVREHGYRIRSWQGDFDLRVPVCTDAQSLGPCDLVLVGMKATENGAFPELLRHTCHESTVVLTLQNGLGNEDAIAAALETLHPGVPARERVLGAVAFLCSTRPEPGLIRHTDHGRIRLAELTGPATERTHQLAQLFIDADFPCEVSDSIGLIRWEKLMWNVPFNGLGVGAGHAHAEAVMRDPELRAVAHRLMMEVRAAANACGAPVPESFIQRMFDATETIGAYRSSMQLDYEAGRPLEVEAILGEPLRRARAAGVDTPTLAMLYAVVRRLDRRRQAGEIE